MSRKAVAIAYALLLVLLLPAQPVAAFSRDHRNSNEHTLLAKSRGIPWGALTQEEMTYLQEYRQHWPEYSPEEQERLYQGMRRYLDLPPDQRREIKRQHHQFEKMTPEERQHLREKYRRQKFK